MALNPITYLRESKAEFAKVVWPTRTQAIRLTVMVIVVSVIIGLYIAGLDAVFTKITETFLIK